jgi:GntR family transcriptional regulator, transcriptional repressor for pyruvate dehydrogenase complex
MADEQVFAQLAPVARSSIVDVVAEKLKAEILSGRLLPLSKLPSERDLSAQLGVNRLTLRASLARLEAQGYIETRHGSATRVSEWRERAGLEALGELMVANESNKEATHELLVALLEVRRVLVAEVIALAAERKTDADVRELRAIAVLQKGRVGDAVAFARGDIAFQRVLVRAAQNLGFELMLNTFARFPDEHPALMERLYDRMEDGLEVYDVIFAILREGDSAAARDGVRSVLQELDEQWLERQGRKRPVKKRR